MDNNIESLLSTLEFLHNIGAQDSIAQQAQNKYDMRIVEAVTQKKNEFSNTTKENQQQHVSHSRIVNSIAPSVKNNNSYVAEAKQIASKAESLQELKVLIEKFNGCALKNTAMNTVFADGQPNADIMLIGEAPGADEDKKGLPFVGVSGQLLDKAFAAIGYSRKKNIYISNVIPWRPPGNRTPTAEEIAMCYPFIERHIYLIKPKLCILVGGTAVKAILQTQEGISKIRGKWLDYSVYDHNMKITAVFHPAYLLRSPGQKKHMWLDLLKIKHYVNSELR